MMIYTKIPKSKPKLRPKKEREEYEEWLNSHKVKNVKKRIHSDTEKWSYSLTQAVVRHTKQIPSRSTGLDWAPAPKKMIYTGDKMIGIGTLHKSNAVPVFTQEEAEDMAKMRR